MIKKASTNNAPLIRVTFILPSAILANRVNLVGDFNTWDPQATPMRHNVDCAQWEVSLDLEPGRRYRFRYLVDGQEGLNDWHADDFVENPYGSYDSVLNLADVLLPA